MMARARFSLVRRSQRGIALLEAMLAVVLLSIGLVGTLALQARSVAALSESALRAEATVAANQLLGVMYNDQLNLADYAVAATGTPGTRLAPWAAELRKNIPGATLEVTVTPSADTSRTAVRIGIGWQRTSSSMENKHIITSYLARTK